MSVQVANQPHDMEMEVSDSESVDADQSHAHVRKEEAEKKDWAYSSQFFSSPFRGVGAKCDKLTQSRSLQGDEDDFAFGDEYSSRDDTSPQKGGKQKVWKKRERILYSRRFTTLASLSLSRTHHLSLPLCFFNTFQAPAIKQVQNQPFDARVEVEDEESIEGLGEIC